MYMCLYSEIIIFGGIAVYGFYGSCTFPMNLHPQNKKNSEPSNIDH